MECNLFLYLNCFFDSFAAAWYEYNSFFLIKYWSSISPILLTMATLDKCRVQKEEVKQKNIWGSEHELFLYNYTTFLKKANEEIYIQIIKFKCSLLFRRWWYASLFLNVLFCMFFSKRMLKQISCMSSCLFAWFCLSLCLHTHQSLHKSYPHGIEQQTQQQVFGENSNY